MHWSNTDFLYLFDATNIIYQTLSFLIFELTHNFPYFFKGNWLVGLENWAQPTLCFNFAFQIILNFSYFAVDYHFVFLWCWRIY